MIFPVKSPYTIGVDIKKHEGEVLDNYVDSEYLIQKRGELESHRELISGTFENGYAKYLSEYTGKSGSIEEIALQMNEDIAILKDGRVVEICFAFPSGFTPSHLLGKNFFEIHAPVPEGDKLRKASDNITSLISKEGGIFRRYVWSLSPLKSLSQLPVKERPEPSSISDIWFRTETQSLVGLRDGVTLFFIKVNMTPLKDVWGDPEKRTNIVDSVNSMSHEILNYKGLSRIKEILNETMAAS
jgi:hypothetical protein